MARVLIVDDEPMFHELLSTVLDQYCGHQSASADNGAQALAMVASGEVFDLIITDLRMPVMTGPELIAALRGMGCAAPVILMTGDANPPRIKGVRTLRKPFDIATFTDAVGEELSQLVS